MSNNDIAKIADPTLNNISTQPDELASKELAQLENDYLRLRNFNFSQDIELRKKFSNQLFILVCAYLGFVGVLLFLNFWCPCCRFNDSVLITLLTTTTANIIGMFIIVVRNLFPRK